MSELKAINALGVRKDDGAYYDRKQADEYIDELDERHTTEITALEVSYRLQLDGLRYDKDAEIRKLKRALWLARDDRAMMTLDYFTLKCRWFKDYMKVEPPKCEVKMIHKWATVQRKCRAKVEQYK